MQVVRCESGSCAAGSEGLLVTSLHPEIEIFVGWVETYSILEYDYSWET